jgi:CHAT domain-containing protein
VVLFLLIRVLFKASISGCPIHLDVGAPSHHNYWLWHRRPGLSGGATQMDNRRTIFAYKVVALVLAGMMAPASAQNKHMGMALPPQTNPIMDEWEIVFRSGTDLRNKGKYAEAIPVIRQSVALARADKNLREIATSLTMLGGLYRVEGELADSEQTLKEAISLIESNLGPTNSLLANSLNNLAVVYKDEYRYELAESLFRRQFDIAVKNFGPDAPTTLVSVSNLGRLYRDEGRLAEAEYLLRVALEHRQKVLGPVHRSLAPIIYELSTVYAEEGKNELAETLSDTALAIRRKTLGENHDEYAESLEQRAALYARAGNLLRAEQLGKQAVAVMESTYGPIHRSVANTLGNLASAYLGSGNYQKAEPLLKRALEIYEKLYGPNYTGLVGPLTRLGNLYLAKEDFAAAQAPLEKAFTLQSRIFGSDHVRVTEMMTLLGSVYAHRDRAAEAEKLFKTSLQIREKFYGPNHPAMAAVLHELGRFYREHGRFDAALPFDQRALTIDEAALGGDHPTIATLLQELATLRYAQGNPQEAEPLFERAMQNIDRQFQEHFAYMSEKERLVFLDKVSSIYPLFLSFCFSYRDQDATLIGAMYDVVLKQRNLIGQSVTSLLAAIEDSGDAKARQILHDSVAKKSELAAMLNVEAHDRDEWKKTIAKLEEESNQLERQLAERSGVFASQARLANVGWRDVQQGLGPGEAAVELVHFRSQDVRRLSDKQLYAALVLRKDWAGPKLVFIGEAGELEATVSSDYRQRILSNPVPAPPDARTLYQALWSPLTDVLSDAKRIYLAPDGIFTQLSLGMIASPAGRMLMEDYDLRIVSSSRDLLLDFPRKAQDTAVLVGNPKFDLDEAGYAAALKHLDEPAKRLLAANISGNVSRDAGSGNCPSGGGILCPLPATGTEISVVEELLSRHGWHSQVYRGQAALEESIKGVQHPRVLHIATHGFFLPEQQVRSVSSEAANPTIEDPMLRSGLYFAGADRTLSGVSPSPDRDDGVLTASEAVGLHLRGTELVVLSACDTGLGEVKAGEGVFGLRRALQEAGAQSILMSMWSVPDRETSELMKSFYEKWLDGEEKHEALRKAELEEREVVRQRYGQDIPFYWGAFVLVGR